MSFKPLETGKCEFLVKLKEEASYEGSTKLILPRPAMPVTPSVKPQKRKDQYSSSFIPGEKKNYR